jgi:hypothetical protein
MPRPGMLAQKDFRAFTIRPSPQDLDGAVQNRKRRNLRIFVHQERTPLFKKDVAYKPTRRVSASPKLSSVTPILSMIDR